MSMKHNFESLEKCPIEQVHLQFCKCLLGVSRSQHISCARQNLGDYL